MIRRRRNKRIDHTNPQEVAEAAADLRAVMEYQPHNVNAEAATLGALMLDNTLLTGALSMLEADHFMVPEHARIFAKIKMLVGKGRLANPVTLHPYFEGESLMYLEPRSGEKVYGPFSHYLVILTGSNAPLLGAAQIGKQVFNLAMLRQVSDASRQVMTEVRASEEADADPLDPAALIGKVEDRFGEISDAIAGTTVRKGKYFGEAFTGFRQAAADVKEGAPAAGITIAGYADWNDVVGRMGGGDLIYLGGRPSMGKTGVACAVAVGACEAALADGKDTAVEFLSLEMKEEIITRRAVANMMFEQGVTSTYRELQKGNFTDADVRALDGIGERMEAIALHIDDPEVMYVEDLLPYLRRRKRAWAAKGKTLRLVVIDYLGLFETRRDFRSPQERMTHISKMVKRALREADVAGVVLVQLSRKVEERDDKRPQLSDLRDSGSLEQDADVVVFVYRDEYYLDRSQPPKGHAKYQAWADDMLASRDRLELIGAKARESALSRRTGYFFAAEQAVRGSDFYQTADMFGGY